MYYFHGFHTNTYIKWKLLLYIASFIWYLQTIVCWKLRAYSYAHMCSCLDTVWTHTKSWFLSYPKSSCLILTWFLWPGVISLTCFTSLAYSMTVVSLALCKTVVLSLAYTNSSIFIRNTYLINVVTVLELFVCIPMPVFFTYILLWFYMFYIWVWIVLMLYFNVK